MQERADRRKEPHRAFQQDDSRGASEKRVAAKINAAASPTRNVAMGQPATRADCVEQPVSTDAKKRKLKWFPRNEAAER